MMFECIHSLRVRRRYSVYLSRARAPSTRQSSLPDDRLDAEHLSARGLSSHQHINRTLGSPGFLVHLIIEHYETSSSQW